MISKITGTVTRVRDDDLALAIDALEYTIYIPEFARRQLQDKVGQEIVLHTIQYLEGNPAHGRMTPRLIGFMNEVELEFFELFCSVDGVGVKKALRAMIKPVRDVAEAIEQQEVKLLSSLPGIGPASSERIIAKLRRKMSKFALMAISDEPREADVDTDVINATYEVLLTLGHSERDARGLLDSTLAVKKNYKDVESLLQAIYQHSHAGA